MVTIPLTLVQYVALVVFTVVTVGTVILACVRNMINNHWAEKRKMQAEHQGTVNRLQSIMADDARFYEINRVHVESQLLALRTMTTYAQKYRFSENAASYDRILQDYLDYLESEYGHHGPHDHFRMTEPMGYPLKAAAPQSDEVPTMPAIPAVVRRSVAR